MFNSPLKQSENTCKSSLSLYNSLQDVMKVDPIDTSDTSTADFPPDIPSATSQAIDKFSQSRPPVQVPQSVSKSIAMDRDEVLDSNANSRRDKHGGNMMKAGIETTSIDSITRDEEPVHQHIPLTDISNHPSQPVEGSSAYNVSKKPTDQVAATDIDVQNGNNSTVNLESIKSIPPANNRPSKSKEAAASSTLKEQPSNVPNVQNASNEGVFENFGGLLVNHNKLSLCDRSGKLSKFVNDVMLLIFSRQEMADSSITGKRANVHAKRDVNEVREKKQLDRVKVKALIEYIKKEFPGSEEKKIIEAIRSKLKYEATRVHGVGFRKPDNKNTETIVVDMSN